MQYIYTYIFNKTKLSKRAPSCKKIYKNKRIIFQILFMLRNIIAYIAFTFISFIGLFMILIINDY